MKAFSYILIFYFTFKMASSSNFLFTDTEFRTTLDLVKKLGIRHCILIGGQKYNTKIISDVKKFSSVRLPSVYLDYKRAISHIDASVKRKINYYRTAIIFNKDAVLYELLLISRWLNRQYSLSQSFPFRFFTWLTFTHSMDFITEGKFNIPYSCKFIVIMPEKGTSFKLIEFYKVKNNSFALDFGTWSRHIGLKIPDQSFYWRRMNLNASILTKLSHPDYECPISYSGCLINEIITLLTDKMNFRLQTILDQNAMESFQRGNGDFINLQTPYNQWVAMLGPVINIKMPWFIKDQRTGLRPDYYFQPFVTNMWLAILFSTVFFTIFSLMINKYIDRENKRTWVDDIFLGMESLCGQCGNDYLENGSLRLAFLSLQIIVIFMAGAYGAVITSFLAVQKLELPFENAEGFLANGQYKLGTQISTGEHWVLSQFGEEIFFNSVIKKIYDNHTIKFDEDGAKKFFKQLCSNSKKYAVTDSSQTIFSNKVKCKLVQHPEPLVTLDYGMPIALLSPLTEAFNIFFRRLYLESGIKKRHQDLHDSTKVEEYRLFLAFNIRINYSAIYAKKLTEIYGSLKSDEDDAFTFVEFSQVVQVISIPFIGLLIAILVLVGELVHEKFSNREMMTKILFISPFNRITTEINKIFE